MGPLIPLFWTSGDIYPGFQSQGGYLACFFTCVILRFTSGVTPADCTAGPFRSMYVQTCPQALVEVRGSNLRPSVFGFNVQLKDISILEGFQAFVLLIYWDSAVG